MNKEKKSVPFLSIGSSSLLVVFLVLCLVIFAMLTLTGTQSDYRFSRQLADRRTAYYAACNQAEEQIASLDAAGELKHMTESLSFQVQISDRQALFVELSPDGTDGYVISAWQTISTGDWNSTSGSPGIGISNED